MAEADVVVVGAGPNGLSAAVALARAGCQVTVFEAQGRIGGGTRTEELTLPGFRHDVCAAVHPMAASSPFFRQLPLDEHGLEWIHPPVLLAHPFDDGTAAFLLRSTSETAAGLGKDGKAYRRLMDPFVENWEALLREALAPHLHIPRRPLLLARLGVLGLQPALTLTRRRFETGRARALLVGIAAHTLLPMNWSPSAAYAIVLSVAGHGVGWPFARGGSQAVTNALAALLHERGGRIETGTPIHDIDALPAADATLLDLTARQVVAVAGHHLPARYRGRLERFRYGPGVFKMDWALSEPIPWTAEVCHRAGTLHLGGSVPEVVRSAELAWEGRHDEQPFIILAQPSLFDPTRAPAGQHTAWSYCHVPHGSTRDMTKPIEQQIERFAPGFRETVLARSTRNTRQMEAHDANLVGGDINGGAQDLMQFLFRPVPSRDPLRDTDARPVHLLFFDPARRRRSRHVRLPRGAVSAPPTLIRRGRITDPADEQQRTRFAFADREEEWSMGTAGRPGRPALPAIRRLSAVT